VNTELIVGSYINEAHEIVIPAIFNDARPFRDGFAAVDIGSHNISDSLPPTEPRWGLINTRGEIAIPFEYSGVGFFFMKWSPDIPFPRANGFVAMSTGRWEQVSEDEWVDNTRWGFVDINGEVAVPFEYSHIMYVGSHDGREYFWANSGTWDEPQWVTYVARPIEVNENPATGN
jgi:hypothetical protein